jgi:hypothetical protein
MSGYIGTQPVPQATQTRDSITATNLQTVFPTSGYTPQFLDVYLNGIFLSNGADYTATNGSDVILASGAATGDILEVVAYSTFEVLNPTFSSTLDVASTAPEMRLTDLTDNGYSRLRYDGAAMFIEVDDGNTVAGSNFRIQVDGTEAMRIDDDRNVLIGKTAIGSGTVGTEIFDTGLMRLTRNGNTTLISDRINSYGTNVEFRYNGATKGSIKIPATDNFSFIGENGNATIGAADTGLIVSANESIRPFNPATNSSRDSAIGLGESYAKFTDVWAVDGSINTSDGNEKQDIASLTATEMLVAKRISVLFKTFKWKTAVEKKGDDARTHTGVIAQDVQAAFTAEGLDAGDYAMFMSDTWWETQTEVPAVEAGEDVEAKDAYTRTDIYDTEAEAPEGATERTRLGIRYHELLCFVSAYNEQRFATLEANQTTIEARLTALEGV